MPIISIVVPVYKVETYLEPCVRSIMAQTYRDLEIILVDDGSPDSCGRICDELAAEDDRIIVIHQKNKGLSGARNTGIQQAHGQYICFVDSDDLLCPEYCEKLYLALTNSACDFSVCAVHRYEDGEQPHPKNHSGPHGIVSNQDFLQMQFERKTEFGVWNKLFPKALVEDLQFMEGKIHEDVIFSADLARNLHHGVACVGDELYLYRQRAGGIVSNHAKRCSPDLVFAGAYLLNAVEEKCPDLAGFALKYAVQYPWSFVDPIYVHREFRDNQVFLDTLQTFLKEHMHEYEARKIFSDIQTRRMKLFSKSRVQYGVNAYARLARVYLYHLIGKDAYQDGHGI